MEEITKINLEKKNDYFIDFCKDDLKITTNSGLKLFTNNIYTNNRFVRDLPFVGQKLYLYPFNFGVKDVLPNEITINTLVQKEIRRRFDNLNSYTKQVLHNDLTNNKTEDDIRIELKKRENLHSEFIGTVTTNSKEVPKPGHVCVCLEDVRLRFDHRILTDHLWVTLQKNLFEDLKINPGNKITFFGVIYPYIQFDQVNMYSFIDYSIKVMTFYKNNL